MPRVRKSSKSKPKNRKTSSTGDPDKISVRTTRLSARKSKYEISELNSFSSNSQTSPFKGFTHDSPDCNISLKRCPSKGLPNDAQFLEKQKNDAFDKLFSQNSEINLNHNIRTYINKAKDKRLKDALAERELLHFQDGKNRDDVIRWLNNTQNVFERLTQTQNDPAENSDVNSVSFSTQEMPSVSQVDPVKTPKRMLKRRPRRSPYKTRARSLDIQIKKNVKSGRNKRHSLGSERSFVLEDYQIEDAVTCKDVHIPADTEAKLLIDLMESEYLQNIENEMLKHDEKKIQSFTGWDRIKDMNKTINSTKKHPKKLKVLVHNGDHPSRTYDHKSMEEYFCKSMTNIMNETSNKCFDENESCELQPPQVAPNKKSNVVKTTLKLGNEFVDALKKLTDDRKSVAQFRPILDDLKMIFQVSKTNASCQTNVSSKKAQKRSEKCVQTENNNVDKGMQTVGVEVDHKGVQSTVSTTEAEAQTDDDAIEVVNLVTPKTTASSTPSLIFNVDRNEENEENRNDLNGEPKSECKPENIENDLLDTDLDDIDFDTEDMLADKKDKRQTPASSVLVITNENNSKGVKRILTESPVPDKEHSKYKRPCQKFIDEELSVNFSTCFEDREDEAMPEADFKETKQNEYVADVLERDTKAGVSKEKDSRLQEQIEELENLIYNANKRSATTDQRLLDEFDYFKPSSSDSSASTKKSRKRLFDTEHDNDKFSESIFDADETMIGANKTQPRIQILENLVIKPADNVGHTDDNLSDGDFVESTPHKKHTSFSKQRSESVLDVTLPPPLEFQDTEKIVCKQVGPSNNCSTPRRPLSSINKVTSTPFSQRRESQDIISLSPIQRHQKPLADSSQENVRYTRMATPVGLGSKSKFSPLGIIKKPKSQSCTPKQKSILKFVRSTPEPVSQRSQPTSSPRLKPCISCTRLNKDEVMGIYLLTNKNLATYSSTYSPKVTHMIVAADRNNCITGHTIKVVQAIAAGIWVLNFSWIQECVKKNKLVPEEPYEVLDITGLPGPRQSRLTRNVKPLLEGFKIYAAPPFETTNRSAVENVIEMLGGKVVKHADDLLDRNGYICLILTEAKATQDYVIYEAWLDGLSIITVDIEWLCRSVAQYQLMSFRPFVLCAEENIDCLGYPPELMLSVSFSTPAQTIISVPSSQETT